MQKKTAYTMIYVLLKRTINTEKSKTETVNYRIYIAYFTYVKI